ncbi:hypothetical protein [Pontibacter burrus]|uniref:Uncharacterized protein n=1 Tax=Pontibacter burrus TaxID=2704466 RepID=A0A6B3LT15_9BACT|nr:hypothetical protein [Pontibacter burrus]NEM98205.1 hypothetical protein [Pontibacter burrus]
MKKLLSKDYTACFLETFSMLNSDWEAHYHNFVQEYHAANPEIIEGLKKAITAAKGVWMGMINKISLQQIGWEIDDEGNEIKHKPLDLQLSALSFVQHFNFIGRPYYNHIGKWFFDEQLTTIDILDKGLKAWYKGLEYELSLPEEVRQSVQHLPLPTFLDFDALIVRNNRLREYDSNYWYKSLFGIDIQSQVYIKSIRSIVDGEYKFPEQNTFAERWEYFVRYSAQQYLEMLQIRHFSSRAELRLSKFEKLLAKINTFIEEAEEYDINNAFKPFDGSSKYSVYLWLTKEEFRGDRVLQSYLSSEVYAEYVLLKQWLEEQLKELQTSNQPQQRNSNEPINEPEAGIPYFNSDIRDNVYNSLKPHFAKKDYEALQMLLNEGKTTKKPLLFCNNGNLLAYAFNELYSAKLITKCNKKQLKEWIISNFEYQEDNKVVKCFKIDYLHKVMVDKYNFSRPKMPITIITT